MSKKHFIALADTIRANPDAFTPEAIHRLAQRWMGYIAGQNGSNGGKVK